jgi:hypothetical protein
VNNVAPSVTFTSAPDVADEGDTKLYVYSVSDPGQDTFTVDSTYPKCGAHGTIHGTPSVTANGGSFECTFPDGPNVSTVAIKVTDSDGASDSVSEAVQIVQVANVAPSVTAAGDQPSNEGASHSFSLGSFTDPGSDSPWAVSVDWGDGSPAATFDSSTTGSLGTQDHTYADGPNDYTVTVTVSDGNPGGTGSAIFSVHVNNVAPSILISGGASVDEGSVYSLTLGAVTDPGTDTVTSWVVHWGDGSSDTYASNGAKTHTYADGPDDHNVTVDLVDEDGTYLDRADPFSVHVNNVAPSISISGAASVDEGSVYSLTLGAVTDPGADTVSSYVVHWGDGSSDTYGSGGAKTHTYADGPNDYSVTVDLVDEDGTFLDRADPFSVNVNNVAPSLTLTCAPDVAEVSDTTLSV